MKIGSNLVRFASAKGVTLRTASFEERCSFGGVTCAHRQASAGFSRVQDAAHFTWLEAHFYDLTWDGEWKRI